VDQLTSVPAVPPPLPPIRASVAFRGDRGEFFRLVTRGAFIELITFGFYRFWLATDMRRHLWSNTEIDGDAAEYTGRARELLIGFLIALAIIVPVYLAYFLVTLEAERLQAFLSFPLLGFLYVFGQFAIYRARRYRLTRTVWRGVRFWMSGSGWTYAGLAALWAMLVGVTLGLALPWREAALERYKMRHSWYGDLQGSFVATGWEFFKRAWWLWLLTPLAYFFFPVLPFIYAAYKAVEWRWWISGIRFSGVRLESTMTRGALIGLYWKVIGWAVLLFTLMFGYLALCVTLLASMDGTAFDAYLQHLFTAHTLMPSLPLLSLSVAGYLAFALALNIVIRVYLLRDVWARVIATTTVYGIEAADNVAARGELVSALGEGFADGLDVAGF
jgi:uncharacterized membrane protein YjgN (DUF898 family)